MGSLKHSRTAQSDMQPIGGILVGKVVETGTENYISFYFSLMSSQLPFKFTIHHSPFTPTRKRGPHVVLRGSGVRYKGLIKNP